jgi:hypothetical protein
MLISKANKKEILNSISDCYNDHIEKYQKTKNIHDRNFKLQISLNANKIKSEEKQKEKEEKNTYVYQEKDNNCKSKLSNENFNSNLNLNINLNQIQNENQSENNNFTYDKLMIQKNFEKKYSSIMSSTSPKNKNTFFPQKNFNLWELKLKQKSNIDKNQTTKNLENFKLNILCAHESNNSISGIRLEKEFAKDLKTRLGNGKYIGKSIEKKKHFSYMSKTSNFNFNPNSNFDSSYPAPGSDSASASATDFFKSSKSSFYSNKNNNNNHYNYNYNFNPNMSFNSIKSVSYNKNLNNLSLSPRSNYNNNIPNNFSGNINRVNFDDFNSIGENPFKINIYDNNNIAINTISKNYSKYGNMSDEYNLSPRNICSPKKDSLNYHSKKQLYKIDDIYESSPRNNKNKNFNEGINLNSPKNSNLKKFGISNDYLNSRQYTMKRISNLLKKFNDENASFSLSPSLKESKSFLNLDLKNNNSNINKNSDGTFLKKNNKQRLLNLLK